MKTDANMAVFLTCAVLSLVCFPFIGLAGSFSFDGATMTFGTMRLPLDGLSFETDHDNTGGQSPMIVQYSFHGPSALTATPEPGKSGNLPSGPTELKSAGAAGFPPADASVPAVVTCEFHADGFQTMQRMVVAIEIGTGPIMVKFVSWGPDNMAAYPDYRPGETVMKLDYDENSGKTMASGFHTLNDETAKTPVETTLFLQDM